MSQETVAVPYMDLPAQIKPLRTELDEAVARVIDNTAFCLGSEVFAFEKEFAEYCGVKHALGINSGTSALHLALKALDIGPGDEVVTTPYTFVATSWAIDYVGAKPVFVDIDDKSFNMDPELTEKAITKNTKAILPVHIYGQPFDVDRFLEIGEKHGIPVIEDAAQAHGAKYKGVRVGGLGVMSCFSFYPGKNLGAFGEGGALLTNDDKLAERVKSLRDHGSKVRYYHDEVGYNYRMEGIQGAVLSVKLKHLESWNKRRREIAAEYDRELAGLPLRLPEIEDFAETVYHLYVIRSDKRDALKAHLDANKIGNGLHYPLPLHLQKAFAHLGYREADFPVSEKAAKECLSLPIFPEMTEKQINSVIAAIKKFFAK